MEKSIEKRITLQPYQTTVNLHLTEFPIGNLKNPGIGLKLFDVMLPLHGIEKFEVLKTDAVIPGSFEEKEENSDNNELKQHGFGKDFENSNLNQTKKDKLGPVYDAMQKATIKKSKFEFVPTQSSSLKKKSLKKHKFSFL